MRYEIEYVSKPREALGLPAQYKWNVYKVADGDMWNHLEGFITKREAKAYIKMLENLTYK